LVPWFLVAVGFQIATVRIGLSTDIGTQMLQHVYFLLYLAVAFLAVWRLIHYFAVWYNERLPTNEVDSTRPLIPLVQRIAQLGLILFSFLILLEHFDIRFVAVATALGLGGLAVSFAAKDTLSDIISGIVIIVDQPFRLGDRIEIQDANTRGDIVSIGLRSTHIRTPDNRTAIVPNSVIGNNLIINHTYPDLRIRVQSEVGLPYGIDIAEGCQIIEQAVRKDDAVINDQPVDVLFRSFGDSALIIRVRWWIESYVDRQQSLDSVNAAIYRALNDAHVQFPFPQRDLHHIIDSDDLADLSRMMTGGQSI
jgi:MscS family membrane protein